MFELWKIIPGYAKLGMIMFATPILAGIGVGLKYYPVFTLVMVGIVSMLAGIGLIGTWVESTDA